MTPILSSDWSGEEPALAEVSGLGRGGGRGTAASPGAGPAASWGRRPGELGWGTLGTWPLILISDWPVLGA